MQLVRVREIRFKPKSAQIDHAHPWRRTGRKTVKNHEATKRPPAHGSRENPIEDDLPQYQKNCRSSEGREEANTGNIFDLEGEGKAEDN